MFDFDQENHFGDTHADGDHETVKLTKDVSWEEEEEEVTEHYLKIYAKYITDGQVKYHFVPSLDFQGFCHFFIP